MDDLIIVPGGGLRRDGSLPPWVANRFDRALELRQNEPILCLSAGTVHKPNPLDASGCPVFEAVAGARYLAARGLSPGVIFVECSSWETIGNAFFARTQHTDLREWRRLLVVNSAFHMQRTEAIFRWVFGLAPIMGYELSFETVPDVGMAEPDLDYRRARERRSLEQVHSLRKRIRTMPELHAFLFTEHRAYTAAALLETREPAPEELQRVY